MSDPDDPGYEGTTSSKLQQCDETLRNEIIESEKSQSDILKWKLISIAGVSSVSFGIGNTTSVPEAAKLLICLVPLICAYVDLISLHLMIRIITIGAYLKQSGSHYEQFAFEIRNKTYTNPFVFEAVVLHGSSLVFNIIILGLAFALLFALPKWPPAYMVAYAVAGILGIVVTIFSWVKYTMLAQGVVREAEKFFSSKENRGVGPGLDRQETTRT